MADLGSGGKVDTFETEFCDAIYRGGVKDSAQKDPDNGSSGKMPSDKDGDE